MNKIKEVVFNAVVYRIISVLIQLLIVLIFFGLVTNWKIVVVCNIACLTWYIVYHMFFIEVKKRIKKNRCNRVIRAYMSHPIRGSKGDNATHEDQIVNSEEARRVAFEMKKKIPWLDIYCPGDAERFVYETYSRGWLTDDQILSIDCHIEGGCDFVIVYEFDKLGSGSRIEIKDAHDNKIPVFWMKKWDDQAMKDLIDFINRVVKPN